MNTLSKVGTFQKELSILNIISGMIPSFLCYMYVPPSLELLGLMTPMFVNPDQQPPCFQTGLTPQQCAILSLDGARNHARLRRPIDIFARFHMETVTLQLYSDQRILLVAEFG